MNGFDEIVRLTRDEFEPSAGDRVRVKQRLFTKVADIGLTVSLATGARAARAGSVLGGQSLGALSKLFFGSLLATWVGVGGVVAVTRSVTRPVESRDVATGQTRRAAPKPSRAPSSVERSAPAGVAAPAQEPAAAAPLIIAGPTREDQRPRGAPEAPLSAAPAAPAASGNALEAELGLLGEARRALTDGDLARATRTLDGLDQSFPEGLLLEERRALRAMTKCKADGTRDGAVVFLQRYPRSIYAAKVRRTCGLENASPSAAASVTDRPSTGH